MPARNTVASRRAAIHERSQRALSEEEKERVARRKTPPKKYEDRERTVLTAEYQHWFEVNRRRLDPTEAEMAYNFHFNGWGDGPANHSVYYPEEYDKDLEDGAWVFVIDPPVTEQWDRFQVPLLSIWWARPHVLNDGAIADRLPYQGIIQTPAGDLHLWPHEYTICKDVKGMLGEPGVEIHTLGGSPLIDEDQLFYLMQRGISARDAIVMLWDQVETGDFAYITMPREAVDMFVGVGARTSSDIIERYKKGLVA